MWVEKNQIKYEGAKCITAGLRDNITLIDINLCKAIINHST